MEVSGAYGFGPPQNSEASPPLPGPSTGDKGLAEAEGTQGGDGILCPTLTEGVINAINTISHSHDPHVSGLYLVIVLSMSERLSTINVGTLAATPRYLPSALLASSFAFKLPRKLYCLCYCFQHCPYGFSGVKEPKENKY